jgi:uncharacterized protein (DUF2147 family)
MRFPGLLIAAFASSLMVMSSAAYADPVGEWRVADDHSTVQIKECGADTLCGYVASGPDPKQHDMRNPDKKKRARSILGMEVLIDLKKEGPDKWTGTSYNAEDGQTYTAHVTQKDDGSLQVEGYNARSEAKLARQLAPFSRKSPDRLFAYARRETGDQPIAIPELDAEAFDLVSSPAEGIVIVGGVKDLRSKNASIDAEPKEPVNGRCCQRSVLSHAMCRCL